MAVLALALALLVAACAATSTPGAGDSASSVGPPASGSASGGPSTGVKGDGTIGHVFVINLENKSYSKTWGPKSKATFLNSTLVSGGKLLTQYYATAHASLGNYTAQISGQAPTPDIQTDCHTFKDFEMTGTAALEQAVGTGCVYPSQIKTVADQLDAKRLTWKGYMEDMGNDPSGPSTCRHPAIGEKDPTQGARVGDQYAAKHNPFVYFHSIIDSPLCQERVVPLDALATDLAKVDTTPNLSYISPSLCHDGHDEPCVNGEPGGLVSADELLKQHVGRILESPAYKKDGLVIITFDEAELVGPDADSTACCNEVPGPNSAQPGLNGPGGGRVGALLLSPYVKANTTSDTPYNHYGLLCSIESIFGLDKLGMAGQPGLACFDDKVFDNRTTR